MARRDRHRPRMLGAALMVLFFSGGQRLIGLPPLDRELALAQVPSRDCCVPRDEPGCRVPACETCVCNVDDFCCDDQWDEVCVEAVEDASLCAAACQCASSGCTGDCDEDGTVTEEEFGRGIHIVFAPILLALCRSFDRNSDMRVTTDELVASLTCAAGGGSGLAW